MSQRTLTTQEALEMMAEAFNEPIENVLPDTARESIPGWDSMGALMLIQSLGQFLGTWLVPLLLGPDVSAWMFTGIVMCVIGFAGTAALALCKFK